MPAPTGNALKPHCRQYVPLPPTRTTALDTTGLAPPQPQPGAVPVAPGASAKPTVAPPPKAGEKHRRDHGPEPTGVPTVPSASQLAVPAPTVPLARRGTATTTAVTGLFGGHAGGLGGGAEHPPGYQQNANGAEPTSHGESRALYETEHDTERSSDARGDDDGVWSSAKKWAQTAGEKLSAAESEVWRRINKD